MTTDPCVVIPEVIVETVVEEIAVVEVVTEGPQGPAGPGVPAGGSDGQIVAKDGATPYATKWVSVPGLDGIIDGGNF